MPEDMPEDMSEYMPEDMSDRMPEDMSEYMPEDMPDRMPEDMSDRVPEDMPDRMPEDLPDRMPEDMPEDMPDHMPEDMPDGMPNRMSEDMSDRMPEDLPVRKCMSWWGSHEVKYFFSLSKNDDRSLDFICRHARFCLDHKCEINSKRLDPPRSPQGYSLPRRTHGGGPAPWILSPSNFRSGTLILSLEGWAH